VAELKTEKTNASVAKFINSIDDDQRRKDCRANRPRETWSPQLRDVSKVFRMAQTLAIVD
jgi:hypothetical protein